MIFAMLIKHKTIICMNSILFLFCIISCDLFAQDNDVPYLKPGSKIRPLPKPPQWLDIYKVSCIFPSDADLSIDESAVRVKIYNESKRCNPDEVILFLLNKTSINSRSRLNYFNVATYMFAAFDRFFDFEHVLPQTQEKLIAIALDEKSDILMRVVISREIYISSQPILKKNDASFGEISSWKARANDLLIEIMRGQDSEQKQAVHLLINLDRCSDDVVGHYNSGYSCDVLKDIE